mmetsp:Transcript_72779/g.200855  ORF Transcript_72779/g.200855 Transcript_72779/m.200855 type:complete len:354 (+) Transcript_72779:400-1461(+)
MKGRPLLTLRVFSSARTVWAIVAVAVSSRASAANLASTFSSSSLRDTAITVSATSASTAGPAASPASTPESRRPAEASTARIRSTLTLRERSAARPEATPAATASRNSGESSTGLPKTVTLARAASTPRGRTAGCSHRVAETRMGPGRTIACWEDCARNQIWVTESWSCSLRATSGSTSSLREPPHSPHGSARHRSTVHHANTSVDPANLKLRTEIRTTCESSSGCVRRSRSPAGQPVSRYCTANGSSIAFVGEAMQRTSPMTSAVPVEAISWWILCEDGGNKSPGSSGRSNAFVGKTRRLAWKTALPTISVGSRTVIVLMRPLEATAVKDDSQMHSTTAGASTELLLKIRVP